MSVETPEFLAMCGRMLRAAGKRVGEGDEPELKALIELREDLEEAISAAVAGQRSFGKSWAAIAAGAGMARQSAFERWGKSPPPTVGQVGSEGPSPSVGGGPSLCVPAVVGTGEE